MDIAPKPSVTQNLSGTITPSAEGAKAVPIEALDLKHGHVYEARVQQKVSPQVPGAEGKGQAGSPDEWLVSLNGKLLKVSSKQALELGQTLQLKLSAGSQGQAPSLTVINTGQAVSNKNPTIPSHVSETLSTLSKLLPKQLTLEKGFTLINEVQQAALKLHNKATSDISAKAMPASSTHQTSSIHNQSSINKALELLSAGLTKADEVMAATQSKSATPSAILMKQALSNSGLFMESHVSKGGNLKLFAQQLAQLVNSHQTAPQNLVTQPQMSAPASNQHAMLPNNAQANKQALELIQHLIQQNSSATSKQQTDKAVLPGTEEIKDLKARLLALSGSLLSLNNSSKQPSLSFDSLLAGVLQPELLSTPFNFPKISPDSAAKAKAIFADQELTTGQLLKLLAGMLNRIQFNQLNSLYQSQGGEGSALQSWFFEVPILNAHQQANIFNIRIDKEQGSPSQQQDDEQQTQVLQWKLALSFDLEHLGPIYIQVSLLPPTVSSIIWADKKETFNLAQQEISHFKERLKELGLEVGDILCQKGLPPQQATKLSQSLVDIQA